MLLACGMAILLGATENDAQTSREAFLRELLFPLMTQHTSHVQAAHPDKLETLRALPAYATERGMQLRTLLMIGPNGPKRAHTVVVVIAEEKDFRMNAVLTEDGRISRKGTTPMAPDALARWVRKLSASTLLIPAGSDVAGLDAKLEDAHFDLLLALFKPEEPVLFVADLRAAERSLAERLIELINGPIRAMRPTYPRD